MSVFDAARNKTSFAQPIEHELYARPKVGSSSLRCDDLGHNALFSIRLDEVQPGPWTFGRFHSFSEKKG